jgi:hypothetical protein
MADNLSQVSSWTLKGYFDQQKKNIELYLRLTRKDLDQLHRFPLPDAFMPAFKAFCETYKELEEEYKSSKIDRTKWAQTLRTCAQNLHKHASLIG